MVFELSKEDIEEIAEEYPSHVTIKVKAQDKDLYENVKENYKGDKFTEKLYRFLYGSEDAVCDMRSCDEEVEFFSFGKGFRDVCSRSCSAKKEDSKEVKECVYCEEKMEVYKSENKKYCSHDCYVGHRVEKEDFDEQLKKAREACREKYGSMGFGAHQIRMKIKNSVKEKHGYKHYNNRDKMKRTKKERYGDPNYNNSEQISRKQKRKTFNRLKESDFYSDVKLLTDFENYEGIGHQNRYLFECLNCDEEFRDYISTESREVRCPNCYDGWNYVGNSEKEKELANFVGSVISDQTELVRNDKEILDGKELDIYIPEKNIAIEFDGLYWHSELSGGKERYYHLNKTEKCEEQGIQLIHIFENEWRDKRDIVKRRLRHILGCSDQKTIYARKCEVKEIDTSTKGKFLEKYHLQGAGRSKIKLGLFHGDFFNSNLVGVMTFGTPSVAQGHKEEKRKQWEMKRFALSCPVVGGTGKLFKHFTRNYNADEIKTYADRRWSTKLDNVYKKIGFQFMGTSNPNYFYFHKENPVLKHRFNFRKDQLDEKLEDFDPDLTEWENMQRHGYDRIWDCGHLKYKWKSND